MGPVRCAELRYLGQEQESAGLPAPRPWIVICGRASLAGAAMDISYRSATDIATLRSIVELQLRNHPANLSDDQIRTSGFVTLQHDLPLLEAMAGDRPHSVAVVDGRFAGYALAMTRRFRPEIPVLEPMFRRLDELRHIELHGHRLGSVPWLVMGQICIDEPYRGRGLFRGLYDHLSAVLRADFRLLITEISHRNAHSLAAHRNVGFATLDNYAAPDGEKWAIVGREIC